MKDFLEFVVKQLVEHPDAISIETIENGRHVLLQLKVATEDTGKIIGKKGNNVAALRVLLRAIAARHDKRVELKILS
ncbi:MAG TPA: KH domain-containing protein [Bacteroidota bacterium]|nr:KH domain-containing protein [Bacteroidota bacterium]